MNLKIEHFVIFITILGFASCQKEQTKLVEIKYNLLPINDGLSETDSIIAFVTPYHTRIDQVLDSALSYAPKTISKEDGSINSSAGNLLADVVMEMATPVFKSRTDKEIDLVLLNFGGIRAPISQGKVTARTAFEVMPFENNIVVAELRGSTIRQLINYILNATVPHPIAGIQIVVNKNDRLESVTINGKPFDENSTYFVATSDYLINGGDRMDFFKDNQGITSTDYLIRNALIDYFKKVDTLQAGIDNRFIKLN